jgi:hypothetical protein
VKNKDSDRKFLKERGTKKHTSDKPENEISEKRKGLKKN